MTKKRGKAISFDAMVKFFMRNYDIPTKKDVELLMEQLDRIENLIRTTSGMRAKNAGKRISKRKKAARDKALSATDQVFDVVKQFKLGVGFAEIQSRTGFDDKKVRNIIFRLSKLGRIKRKSRGIYIAA